MASRTAWIVIAVIVVIVIVVAGVLAYMYTQTGTGSGPILSGSSIDIYAGDSPTYGFGSTSTNIAAGPNGPTIKLTAGQTVTITLHNVGTTAHNFAITTAKSDGNTNLAFQNAQIASASSPVAPGSTASTTFTVGSAGNYYYICQVDGHVSLGMWGNVVVS